jgi:hypothetical protein
MANPLDAFKNLKPWQQGAVIAGGVGVVGVVVWQKEKSKKASNVPVTPPTATQAATSGGTAGEIADPTTGTMYPDTAVDPDTGLTYDQEITEYGSVSAADSASSGVSDQAALQGETPQEYVEQTGGYTGTGTTTGSTVTTNAQWMSEVESGLSEQGYTASDIGQALAAYFAGKPLGVSSDGGNLYTIMNLAVSEYGPPPVGSYPLLNGGGSATLPGTGNAVVPNVVGRTDLGTAEGIIKSAGLTARAAGDSPTGNKGSVTAQDPAAGSTVAKGSSVTLTYTVSGGSTPPGRTVKVPNVVGRTDLGTAEAIIRAAGLEAKATGGSPAGNKGTVTAQNPKAGASVAKGSTVTLTYTVKK